ncbi:CoA transferase [Pikeienuella piscinae]|uniref:CoA transferase n=2 Tax=Pikeienuella piscinae TaxID=2748098 RepID=A0A7M3T7I7_9RHOB|nr:CoA transferase [Pikeienuella piscinae]
MTSTALSHLRVLDLTRVRAGPTCCRVLADFGADVIKVEAPAGVDPNAGLGGPRDSSDMQNLHRSKRSLTLNLKTADGLAIFRKLAETADVVVENFRPDVKDRLGVGYDDLRAINPRIVLASISGFGQTGPYASRAGYDQIAQGMGGLMAVTGLPGQGPVRAGAAVADSASGLYGCLGILIALAERERSGEGQWVQTSLLEAQIAMMDFQAARYLVDGVTPGQAGNDHPVSTPMGVVETLDGHLNLAVGGDGQWRALCAALEMPELGDDARFATDKKRLENREACWAALRPVFRARTTAEWIETLAAASVPAGPIYRMDEVFADPQVRHLGIAASVPHPTRGEVRLVGQPVRLSRTPAAISGPAPEAGAETEEILGGLGYGADDIARLRAAGAV